MTANLAAALSERGRVLAVDTDLEMANLDLVFGRRADHVYDLQDVFLRRCSMADALVSFPDRPRLQALFAPLRNEVKGEVLLRWLREVLIGERERYDFILTDCPSGLGFAPEILSGPRSEGLIVATPDRTSVSDGERAADLLFRRQCSEVRLIVNRVRPSLIRRGLAPDIDSIMDSTSLPLLGIIPEDLAVISGENTGVLALDHPKARSRKPFRNIARRIAGEEIELSCFR